MSAASTATACYKPNLIDGGLKCGRADACPEGFSCVLEHCFRGRDAGGAQDADAAEPLDMNLPIDMSPAEESCLQPVPGCSSPSTGVCNPVCQTGCGCHEKCSVSSAGVPACVPLMGQKMATQSCTIYGYGTSSQNDNCAPGAVCLRPGGQGSGLQYCFALCASDDVCPDSRCVQRPVAPQTATGTPMAPVCDVPFKACNPFTNAECPTERPYCYLTTPDPGGPSRTVCDYVPGSGGNLTSCDYSRDCFQHFVCPRNEGDAGRPGVGFCLAACDPSHPCTVGSCQPYGSTYGYCVSN